MLDVAEIFSFCRGPRRTIFEILSYFLWLVLSHLIWQWLWPVRYCTIC